MKRGDRNLIIAIFIVILLIIGALFISKNISGNAIFSVRNPFASVQESINAAKEGIKKQFTEAEKEAAIEAIKQELTPYIDEKFQEAKDYTDDRIAVSGNSQIQNNVNNLNCVTHLLEESDNRSNGEQVCSKINKQCISSFKRTYLERRDNARDCLSGTYRNSETSYDFIGCGSNLIFDHTRCELNGNLLTTSRYSYTVICCSVD